MRYIEILLLVTFLVLFSVSLGLYLYMYVCDNNNCKVFKKIKGENRKDLMVKEIFNDGLWSIAFIGATIITLFFCFFFEEINFNIKNFSLAFIPSFLVIYFILSFLSLHYIRPIVNYKEENKKEIYSERKEFYSFRPNFDEKVCYVKEEI